MSVASGNLAIGIAAARAAAPEPLRATSSLGGPHSHFEEDFGNFLIAETIVDRLVLERAASAARTAGERLDRVLTKLGLVAEANLAAALAKFLSLDLVVPADVPREPLLTDVVEADFVRRNHVLPLARDDDTIAVGVTDPLNE